MAETRTEDALGDLRVLAELFAESDELTPAIIFALLRHFYRSGPFPFDAAALSDVITRMNSELHVNPTVLADRQAEIEKYFEPSAGGLTPRRGVLKLDRGPTYM